MQYGKITATTHDGRYLYAAIQPSNGTKPRLSLVEQVVVAAVLTAVLARLWRWW